MTQLVESRPPINMQHFGAYMDEVLNFSIIPMPRPSYVTPDNIVYQPRLAIFSSNRSKVEAIHTRLVNGQSWNLNPRNNRWEGGEGIMWDLNLSDGVESFRFLQWVRPFLSYKQVEAEVFEEFLRQKREVRRFTEGLVKVPRYATPYERMEVEEELRDRLLQTRAIQPVEPHVPSFERVAGFFDANASLGVRSVHDKRKQAPQDLEFFARCEIVSVRLGLLYGLHNRYGGNEPQRSSERASIQDGPSYQWKIQGYELGQLLKDIEPHLVFRGTQAKFIMDFLKVRRVLSTKVLLDDPLVITQRNGVLQTFVDEWPTLDPYSTQSLTA